MRIARNAVRILCPVRKFDMIGTLVTDREVVTLLYQHDQNIHSDFSDSLPFILSVRVHEHGQSQKQGETTSFSETENLWILALGSLGLEVEFEFKITAEFHFSEIFFGTSNDYDITSNG